VETIPLFLIFLGHVWVDASQGILPVVLPKLKEVFALDYFQVGMMMTVLNVTSSVIQPLFGYISDRIRTGWFVPIGILWTALAMGLLGWIPSFHLALLLVGLAGLGTAAFHPRAMMAVSLISGTRRGFGTAVFSTGGNLGFALGPVVGGFLVLGLGLRATLGLLVPGILLSMVLYFYPADFLKREVSRSTSSLSDRDRDPISIPWIPLIAVCLIVTLRSWVYISSVTYLPMILQGRGIDLKTGSLMLTVFLAGGAAAGLYGGHLSDRLGRRRIIAVSMLLFPLCMALFLKGTGLWLWILAAASGAALLASFAVTIVLAQELLPHRLGLASGLILGLGFGMGGLGTAFSGYLADVWGLSTTAWILAFAPLSAAFLTLLVKVRPESHRTKLA
jgi:FSR family fosmidomycin resistance protein-like MFS transporter